jgi:integrator complex subunit 9
LHLWNASLIDVILISSPMGIMGLPFLTRRKGFSAKVVFQLMLQGFLY